MKVQSALANLDIGIGEIRRQGNDLVLKSRAGSSMDAVITVSAAEVLRTIGAVLSSPSGLLFVIGLPWFWLRQRFSRGAKSSGSSGPAATQVDINKPW
jgi:hypothetical protein